MKVVRLTEIHFMQNVRSVREFLGYSNAYLFSLAVSFHLDENIYTDSSVGRSKYGRPELNKCDISRQKPAISFTLQLKYIIIYFPGRGRG